MTTGRKATPECAAGKHWLCDEADPRPECSCDCHDLGPDEWDR